MTRINSLCLLFVLFCVGTFGDSLRFVAVGDWGGQASAPYTTPIQLQVAKQMGSTAEEFGSQFTLGIGDNFYDKGIPTNENDKRFNETFESVYTHPALQSRWYLVAGNHDHLGNVTAQIRYTTHSNRWYFPHDWYDVKMTIPGTNVTVHWLFIDTVVFVEWFNKEAEKEYKWIEDTLKASTADWIFVCGHYPVWSIGSHGPTSELVEYLKPLLEKHKVAAYFSGHDHNMQHLQQNGVNYYLTGAGHAIDTKTPHKDDVPEGVSKFFFPSKDESHGAFVTVEVDTDSMVVTYLDDEGNHVYSYTQSNPRRQLKSVPIN